MSFRAYYFAYFAIINVVYTFLPLHFKTLHYSPFELALFPAFDGISLALAPLVSMQLAHHLVSPRKMLVASAGLGTVFFVPLLWLTEIRWTLLLFFISFFLFKCGVVHVEAAAIDHDRRGVRNYARLRIAGSIGFIVTTFCLGALVDRIGAHVIVPSSLFFAALVVASAFAVRGEVSPEVGKIACKADTTTEAVLTNIGRMQTVLIAFICCELAFWFTRSAQIGFFSLHLKQLQWSGEQISLAWNIGVGAEVIMLLFFREWQSRSSLWEILRISVLLTITRWFILGLAIDSTLILLSQLLHAFTFASFQVSSAKLIAEILPPSWRTRGQAILLASTGIGIVVGNLVFGRLAETLPFAGDYRALFLISAVLTFVPYGILAWHRVTLEGSR